MKTLPSKSVRLKAEIVSLAKGPLIIACVAGLAIEAATHAIQFVFIVGIAALVIAAVIMRKHGRERYPEIHDAIITRVDRVMKVVTRK